MFQIYTDDSQPLTEQSDLSPKQIIIVSGSEYDAASLSAVDSVSILSVPFVIQEDMIVSVIVEAEQARLYGIWLDALREQKIQVKSVVSDDNNFEAIFSLAERMTRDEFFEKVMAATAEKADQAARRRNASAIRSAARAAAAAGTDPNEVNILPDEADDEIATDES